MKTIRNNRIFSLLCILIAVLLLAGCTESVPKDGAESSLTLDVFAVGKADAMLLVVDGYSVLIDTGENGDGDELVSALQERGIETLDLLILTHFDKDHIGGADTILNEIPVSVVRMPAYESDSKQYAELIDALETSDAEVVRMTADATFSLGGADFVMWVSDIAYDGDNDNEQSLVTKVVYGGKTYLFAGDAEDDWLNHLCFSTRNLTCDVLKVPHHGGDDDSTFALLTVTMPSYAIVTDSIKNPADSDTLSLLNEYGVETYRTSVGAIRITQSGASFSIGYAG